MAQAHLRKVKKAREKRDVAEHAFHAAIVAAKESGETFRDIGQWAGLSHQRVAEIVRDWKQRPAPGTLDEPDSRPPAP